MLPIRTLLPISVLALLSLTGCQQFEKERSQSANEAAVESGQAVSIRNNCASLLFQLVSEEKNLSKLLLIKRESDRLEAIVKEISSAAARHADALEKMAKQDRTLNLSSVLLPEGEVRTRKAIAKAKQDQLLHSSGADFELALLLTQVEALNYGAHLARVAADSSREAHQAEQFRAISAGLQRLHGKVVRLLKSSSKPPK